MKHISILLLFLVPYPIFGQGITLKGDGVRTVKVDKVVIVKEDALVVQSFPFEAAAPEVKFGTNFWAAPTLVFDELENGGIKVTGGAKGQHKVTVKILYPNLDADGKFLGNLTKIHSTMLTIGDVPAPIPPTPEPIPQPKVDPAPIPLPGLRVLMIYEENAADKAKLQVENPDQYWALFGGEYRDWFIANCVKGADGKTPELRIWDKDANATNAEKHWRDTFERNKTKGVPYMVISNHPRGGWEGPMPKTNSEIKAKLEAFK